MGLYPILLYPFSLIYRLLGFLRKIFTKEVKLCAPVICVGNASVGGTGKTPLIKALGKYFASDKKLNLVVISKGYGGNYVKPTIVEPNFSACLVGDEALELADHLFNIGNVTIIVAKNPSKCAAILAQIKPDIILVDDGMQNPSFHKDFKILMVDGIRDFGNGMLIPSGPMRENPIKAIKHSDIVVSNNPTKEISSKLANLAGQKYIELPISTDISAGSKDQLFLVCGIGNPEKFFNPIEKNYNVVGKLAFPDHHKYTNEDASHILGCAKKAGCTKIVTTAKDYVKLRSFKFDLELVVATQALPEQDLKNILERISEKIQL